MAHQPLAPTDVQAPKGLYEDEGKTGADTKPEEPSGGMAAGESHPVDSKDGADAETSTAPPPDQDYPPQLHAGKVGYGPEYGQSAGFEDKIAGLKDEIKGKLTRNPELTEHGHDRMTGELKHKEQEADDANSPFGTAEEKKEKTE